MTEHVLLQTRRDALLATLALAGGAGAIAAAARAETPGGALAMAQAAGLSGDLHDWDYVMGDWTAVNRKLKKRWTNNPEWDEFPSRARYVQYLGGAANIDETTFPTKGSGGLTVRVFDQQRRLWSIYWVDSKNPSDLGTPMVGGYRGEHGLFYGEDEDDGQPIKVRFIRTKQPPDKDRWEQAFSKDGGASWETNWTADFTRIRA